jgi:molybdate transport system regulatory protein
MPRHPFRIASALSVETRDGVLAGPRRMALLMGIAEHRSIAAAARAVGITYKAAWDAVEAMNNLAGDTLVQRAVGGRGGGGATLTARGHELVEIFRAVASRNERFMSAVNRRSAGQRDMEVMGRLAVATSARNQLAGTVQRIQKGAVNDLVELALPGGARLVAIVTRDSVASLGLAAGRPAIALIKASSIIVASGTEPLRLSARNRLAGRVARVRRGAVNSEVIIDLTAGGSIAAVVTHESVRELALAKGRPASAIFKASSVILAVAS